MRSLDRTDESWMDFLRYVALPGGLGAAFVCGFYLGPPELRRLIAPVNRELGLLENVQNLLLATSFFVASMAAVRATVTTRRVALILLAGASMFLFMEEIDYGIHFVDLVRGTAWDSLPEGRSIHHLDDGIERGIKLAGYLAVLAVFVIAPRLANGRRWKGLEFFVPREAFLGTVVAAFVVGQLAYWLEAGTSRSHGLTHNVSEFHELMLYCILCLYVLDLERERKSEPAEAVEATARGSVEREDSGRPGTSAVA